jgi:hypothetical protein
MTRFVTIPADVVPLAYSGLELEVWRLTGTMDRAFHTREENPGWFEAPLERLERACELARVIDWPRTGPPVEADVKIDAWRDTLLAGLVAELDAQRDHHDAPGNNPELREASTRAITATEGFIAALPGLEAEAAKTVETEEIAERAIVLQLTRDDHAGQWTRRDLHAEIADVEPRVIDRALERLRDAGAVQISRGRACASPGIRCLDGLGMVSI